MQYPHTVTFEAPTKTQMPSGQKVASGWDGVDGLEDLACRVIPVAIGSRTAGGDQETRTERMLLEEERYTIVVQGDRAVTRDMRAVTSYLDLTLGVIRVLRPTLGASPLTNTTLIEAERVGVGLPV